MDYHTNQEISNLQCSKFFRGIKQNYKMILMQVEIITKVLIKSK